MRRFYFDPETRNGEMVLLSEQESYHISRVLRLQPQTEIELIDGLGGLFAAKIIEVGRSVAVRIVDQMELTAEVKTSLWVGQGLLKGKKMDTTIQQCTELGATRLTPFISSRCQGRPDEMQKGKKTDRWDRIVLAACKQCRRPRQMVVDDVIDFPAMLALVQQEWPSGTEFLKLVFWEEEENVHLQQIMPAERPMGVSILLGPEGGFSKAEIAAARDMGWQTVSLGSQILRAETATLCAVSISQYLVGNI